MVLWSVNLNQPNQWQLTSEVTLSTALFRHTSKSQNLNQSHGVSHFSTYDHRFHSAAFQRPYTGVTLAPLTLQNLYKRQLYCVDSGSSSQVRPCDALFEPEKDQKEENLQKIWPSVLSDLILYAKSGLLCIFQSRKMEEEKWSALSPRLFSKVRKEKEVSQALSFLKSLQRAVLQQQRLRRDITISLFSNNVSLTKIPWSGNLSTFLSLKSELVKLKT